MLKSISRESQPLFISKRNKRQNQYDSAKRITTTLCGKQAIRHFLKEKNEYTLVVPIGNVRHEACIFFKINNSKLEAIFFNPNYSEIHDGVEYSKIAHSLVTSLGINKTMSYYAPNGNVDSECCKLTWVEIFNHLIENKNPFKRNDILLENYDRMITQHTYERYHPSKRAQFEENELKFYCLWKKTDEKLRSIDISDTDLIKICRNISQAIANYFSSKPK